MASLALDYLLLSVSRGGLLVKRVDQRLYYYYIGLTLMHKLWVFHGTFNCPFIYVYQTTQD